MTSVDENTNIVNPIPPPSSSHVWETSAELFARRLEYEKPIIEEIEKARALKDLIYQTSKLDDTGAKRKEVRAEKVAKLAELSEKIEASRLKKENLAALEARRDELLRPRTQAEEELEEAGKELSLDLAKVEERKAAREEWRQLHGIHVRRS